MADTFTKFDQLGSTLTELSFQSVSLHVYRHADGEIFYSVNLHPTLGECIGGNGDTPAEALEDALRRHATKAAAKVEAKAAELVA